MIDIKTIEGGVCTPRGFYAGGIRCGIKAGAVKKDLALVYSQEPCTSAAVFTTNRVEAANITVSRSHAAGGKLRALIANSGNANACTGAAGLEAARRMAVLAAERLGIPAEQTAVASTGVIGVPLPLERIEAAMDELSAAARNDALGGDAALEAIMTTDIRKKTAAVELALPKTAGRCGVEPRRGGERSTLADGAGGEASPLQRDDGAVIRIGAMCKGSGMIHPNMATMICVITTDAAVSAGALQRALRRAAGRSFNRLTVDGDMSTNDMALVMANGTAGNVPVEDGPGYEAFAGALEGVCVRLARAMARDGEGATRLLTVTVKGAASEEDAAVLARSAAGSSLVKAAAFGADANWGRVLCALGYAGVPFDPGETSISFVSAAGRLPVCAQGGPLPFAEAEAKKILSEEEITVDVSVGRGRGAASAWGCDLSYDYVKINGDYRS